MANEGDRIEVQFTETEALAQRLLDQLEKDIAMASAVGDELEVARLQAKKQAIGGPGKYARQTPEIEADSAALQRENALRQHGLDIELQTLDTLRQQVAVRAEMAATLGEQRIGATPRLAAPAGTRFGLGHEQLAGQQLAAEEAARAAAARAEEARITEELRQQAALREQSLSRLQQIGQVAGAQGRQLPASQRESLAAGPQGAAAEAIGGGYSTKEQALARYNLALGEYQGFASRASESSRVLSADLTRVGMVQAEASNEMRRHGALTTEWLQALTRGETTLSEFGYQLGATVGKVAGWTAATGATFAALGMLTEFGKGAVDSANGVQQLQRTIDNLNTGKAAEEFRQLSQSTDVPIKEASNAVFLFSRTFHDQSDAVAAARLGLAAYQLDNVQLIDSVKTATALHQQYGAGLGQIATVYDMLAAGQREYNARISDMVPLLQKSSGAVKNAGGDLTQLIQLGTVGLRLMPGLGGNQLGTALYRAAATQTAQHAGELTSQFGLGKDINPLTGQMNFTQLLIDAIKKSATLDAPQRRQLAQDIFGKQYGGRTAAFFGPESASLLEQVTGEKRGQQGPITPEGTRGALQHELDIQLQQVRKQLDQFVNGLQRLGSALAQTGALAPLGVALHAAIASLDALTGLVNVFNQLPGPVKELLSLMVELRLAMLFVSRTRFGSSIPGIRNIPGFRPSEATFARRDLATGTRAAIKQVEDDLARSTASSLTTSARTVEMERQRAAFVAQAGGEEALTAEQLTKSNAMSARIVVLKAEQAKLEAAQTAQETVRADLNAQMVGLTATTRRRRWSDEEVLALKNRTGLGTSGAGAEAGAANRAVEDAAAAETLGLGRGSRAAMGAEKAARGLRAGAAGFVAALDPLTVGLVLFPFVYQSISDAMNAASDATKRATDAANAPVNNAQDLLHHAQTLRQAARQQGQSHIGGLFAPVQGLTAFLGGVLNDPSLMHVAGDPLGSAQSTGRANQLKAIGDLYTASARVFQQDGQEMIKTQKGREDLYRLSQELKQRMGRVLQGSGFSQGEIGKIYEAFITSLQGEYNKLAGGKSGGSDSSVFSVYATLPANVIQKHLQSLDDQSKIYGTNNNSLKNAALGYAALANRARNWTDDASLQAVASAQQNFTNAVNKNVQMLLHSATLGTTDRSQMSDIEAAVHLLQQESGQVQSAFQAAIEYAKKTHEGTKAITQLQGAEKQMLANLADLHKQVISAALQLIKSESDVVTSRVQGISPEADLARQQSTIQGLVRQLNFARGHGADAQQVNDLAAQLNNAQNSALKQQVTNARAIIQAQGQLSQSQITGIAPADDIARAQTAVAAARNLLSYDTAHGLGEAQILQDQAGLYDSVRNLNQQIQQRDQQLAQEAAAFIQAQASLAETQTVNPVKQGREQLAADIKVLSTIKPQDYRTYQEYQTAVLNQKTKVGQDQRSLRQQIVDTDMATLQFELHTQRITDQQYINGLQQLLKMKKLTLQERQSIESTIFDVLHQSAVDLNVGSIKTPSAYEVRSAIHGALRNGRAPRGENATLVSNETTNHVEVKVYVGKSGDVKPVTDAIVRGLNQVAGQAQAVGAI